MAERYDITIIGAGPGGYVAGIKAAQLGLRVAVVERSPDLGGVCLNWGCIPTKALLKNAEMVDFVRRRAREYGIAVGDAEESWTEGVKRSRRVVARMNKGVEGLFKKYGVERIRGSARFADEHTLRIDDAHEGGPEAIESETILIATGSRAQLLPGMELDGVRIISSRHAVALEEVPRRLVVLGAGAVGMEFAYVYSAYGAEVTVLEMLGSALPLEDAEAGDFVAKSFRRRGVRIETGVRVEAVERTDEGVRLLAVRDGDEVTVEGDCVLVAIGRAPVTESLDLDAVGVTTRGGFITVDASGRTNVPNVFAAGDVVGPPMLAHKASHEAIAAVKTAAGLDVQVVDEWLIPRCTYCIPQVAAVGRTAEQAETAGYETSVCKIPFAAIGKAVAVGDHGGWIKLVADAKYGEILGATIVGPGATELIHEVALARWAELTVDQLAAMVYAHPTLSEAVHEAALGIDGSPIHY